LLKAVRHHTDCRWVQLYVERWLKAPKQLADGIELRTMGTPQGGVISPLLTNLSRARIILDGRKLSDIFERQLKDDGATQHQVMTQGKDDGFLADT
jgi:retron-type reverse transcriptase